MQCSPVVWIMLLGLGIFLSGCTSDKPNTAPPEGSMRGMVRQARDPSENANPIEYKCISSKAKEIESDLGASEPKYNVFY
jgi:hypothetical protein